MSLSAVSITATTPPTRRRPVVVVGDKKSNLELYPREAKPNVGSAGGDSDDRLTTTTSTSASKDLNHHLVRAVNVLEGSINDLQNATASPHRTRKTSIRRSKKPLWLKVVSIFTKNFLLLLLLVGLYQLVRKLAMKHGDPDLGAQIGLSELEERIDEIERTMKLTSKILQGQVDIVDKKIEVEVGSLLKEMSEKIEDKGQVFDKELKKLASKSEILEGLLGQVNAADWLPKEEFMKFIEEFKKGKKTDENFGSLDDLRAYARNLVVREIQKHAADGMGRTDYALASGGAKIVEHSIPYTKNRGKWLGVTNKVHSEAKRMLEPSFGEPGHCFPLKGSSGFVQIRLRSAIVPEAFTLEHVAKSVAYDRSSAPKECRVSGWMQDGDASGSTKTILLSEFTYDLAKNNAQTFNVVDVENSSIVNTVRFDFNSNHGQNKFTCIYRLRVHGHEPSSLFP